MKKGLKYDFSLLAVLLIPVGVAINVVGYQLSSILKLPVFLDMIGTVLVAMVAGPWVGIVTGGLGSLVNGMVTPTSIPYAIVAMSAGLVAGYGSRFKMFKNPIGLLIIAIITTVATSSTAAVVTVLLFGGVTGAGTDLITATFVAAGSQIWAAVFTTNMISSSINTIINVGVSMFVIKQMPPRYLAKMSYGSQYISSKKGRAI